MFSELPMRTVAAPTPSFGLGSREVAPRGADSFSCAAARPPTAAAGGDGDGDGIAEGAGGDRDADGGGGGDRDADGSGRPGGPSSRAADSRTVPFPRFTLRVTSVAPVVTETKPADPVPFPPPP